MEEVDRHQQEELKLAICGLSNEYELPDVVAHLEVPAGLFCLGVECSLISGAVVLTLTSSGPLSEFSLFVLREFVKR